MKTRFAVRILAATAAVLVVSHLHTMLAQQAVVPDKVAHTAVAPVAAATVHPAAAQVAGEGENAAPGRDSGGGIKIHGHWLLQVKNPDGKVVDRREFNNSLVTGSTCSVAGTCAYVSGDQLLAALITGDLTSGGLGVALVTGSTAGLDPTTFCPIAANGTQIPPSGIGCYGLLEYKTLLNAWPYGNAFFYGLGSAGVVNSPINGGQQVGLTTSVSFAPQVNIVLSGNFQVGCYESGNWATETLNCGGSMPPITAVQTYMAGCGNATNVFGTSFSGEESTGTQTPNSRFTGANQPDLQSANAPTSCTEANQQTPGGSVAVIMGILTSATVPGGPLVVTTNQIITVTVTISFS
jgi:hypothetical protein